MTQSKKMMEKVAYMERIGWRWFLTSAVETLMARDDSVCKIDRSGKVRYLRQDEIAKLRED